MRESEPKPNISMLDHALRYAAKGWSVFALGENAKVPIRNSHGLKDATTDPILIEALWSANPNYNIAVATGKPSGLIVVDIDPRNKGAESFVELERRYGKMPSTRLSRTPRGGVHRLYRQPNDGQTYGNAIELDKLPGIDVRGTGGYVCIPPSRIFKLSYRFVKEDFPIALAPKWLLDLLSKKEPILQSKTPDQIISTSKDRKWLDEGLQRATMGNRNATLFWVLIQSRDDGASEAEGRSIALSFVAGCPQGNEPFTEREALATLKSVYRRPPREQARRR